MTISSEQKKYMEKLRTEGRSYGQIAAMVKLSANTVKSYCRRVETAKKKCKTCGTPLRHLPGHKQKTYCSDQCRYVWWNGHRDQLAHKSADYRDCAHCGKEFVSYQNRKYCCHSCYIQDRFGKQQGVP